MSNENNKLFRHVNIIAALVLTVFWCQNLQAASYQYVNLTPSDVNKSIGSEWIVSVMYDVSTGNNKLTGIGIRIHYDSSKMEYLGSANMASGNVSDLMNTDEDPIYSDKDSTTDMMIVAAWSAFPETEWPKQPLPFKLVDLTFQVKSGIGASDTSINVTFTSTASGYQGKSQSAMAHITTEPTVSWSTESQNVLEEIGTVDIIAQLSFTSSNNISIPIIVSGTADPITDHDFSNQTLIIPSGQQTVTKTITIVDDNLKENDETIILSMGTPTNAFYEVPHVHTITIQNADEGHFTTPINSTTFAVTFFGDEFTIGGLPAEEGDEIGVFDPDGILCGRTIVTNQGRFQVDVFGDDVDSPLDEGAVAGDVLVFKVWDVSNQSELVLSSSMFDPQDLNNGFIPACPDNPPQWTGGSTDFWGLNIHVSGNQIIPLRAGWNLFSFSVNKVFYSGDDLPDINMLSNSVPDKVDSLDDVLSSIENQFNIIIAQIGSKRYYYFSGGGTYNTLNFLAAGHGYWINMINDADLVLNGTLASPSDSLILNPGWNLIGCWHSHAQYADSPPELMDPPIALPEGVESSEVTELSDVFNAIDGFYYIIRNQDISGIHSYIPGFHVIGELNYISPGYGYWINMSETKDLTY